MTGQDGATTVDAFLGGKVEAVQLRTGHHRAGLEAVLLSSAVASDVTGTIVDLGAGTGVAGMGVAARAPNANVILAERDPDAIAAARRSLALPANAAFANRVRIVEVDISAAEGERVAAGLGRDLADVVVTNPPFRDADHGTRSPAPARRAAHVMEKSGVETWVRAATSVLKADARFIVIFRADGLGALLGALEGRFGGLTVLPIHPRADTPAKRVLVSGRKGSGAPQRILPGFVLYLDQGHGYREPAERILRHSAALADVQPGWNS